MGHRQVGQVWVDTVGDRRVKVELPTGPTTNIRSRW
jgi:hypothetical protein